MQLSALYKLDGNDESHREWPLRVALTMDDGRATRVNTTGGAAMNLLTLLAAGRRIVHLLQTIPRIDAGNVVPPSASTVPDEQYDTHCYEHARNASAAGYPYGGRGPDRVISVTGCRHRARSDGERCHLGSPGR